MEEFTRYHLKGVNPDGKDTKLASGSLEYCTKALDRIKGTHERLDIPYTNYRVEEA